MKRLFLLSSACVLLAGGAFAALPAATPGTLQSGRDVAIAQSTSHLHVDLPKNARGDAAVVILGDAAGTSQDGDLGHALADRGMPSFRLIWGGGARDASHRSADIHRAIALVRAMGGGTVVGLVAVGEGAAVLGPVFGKAAASAERPDFVALVAPKSLPSLARNLDGPRNLFVAIPDDRTGHAADEAIALHKVLTSGKMLSEIHLFAPDAVGDAPLGAAQWADLLAAWVGGVNAAK